MFGRRLAGDDEFISLPPSRARRSERIGFAWLPSVIVLRRVRHLSATRRLGEALNPD